MPKTKTPVKKASTPSKTLAKRDNPGVPANVDMAAMLAQDAGAGQETMSSKDYAIPRLQILQSLSPQIKKAEPAYIKGAEEGMIVDPLNARIFSGEKGIQVVPINYRRAYIEWKDRKSGGGFVKDHGSDDSILAQTTNGDKGPTLPNGNTIQTQGEYFVFLLGENGGYSPYVLSMASSQLKKSRRWNTMINQFRAPHPSGSGTFNPAMFYRSYQLMTVPEKNEKGSFFGWVIAPSKNVLDMEGGQALYLAARDFRAQISSGAVQASAPTATPHEEDDSRPM